MGDKQDALASAVALLTLPASIQYVGSVALESRLWDAAHACGTSRTLIKKIRGRKDYEARGADDERIDTEGALAEIVMALLLEKANADIAPLVAHKPDSGGVDITLDGKKLDVKSIGQGRLYVNINCRAHIDKPADAYVLVHLVRADVADIYCVAAKAVEGWKQNTFLRGAPLDPRRYYYSAKLPAELEALPEETEA